VRGLWLCLLLLAACGGPDTPEAACARQANDDPEVHRLVMLSGGTPYLQQKYEGELAYLRREATLRCLRSRGLAPPGGVESRKPLETPP